MNQNPSARPQIAEPTEDLLRACGALRDATSSYESLVRAIYERSSSGDIDRLFALVSGFESVRKQLTEAMTTLEVARREWRKVLFRQQAASGIGYSDIARTWGLSRQYIARVVNDGAG